jgi:hypothetical protein
MPVNRYFGFKEQLFVGEVALAKRGIVDDKVKSMA